MIDRIACPDCGAELNISQTSGMIKCSYCGSVFPYQTDLPSYTQQQEFAKEENNVIAPPTPEQIAKRRKGAWRALASLIIAVSVAILNIYIGPIQAIIIGTLLFIVALMFESVTTKLKGSKKTT